MAILVVDAMEGFTSQDAHIAGYIIEAGKGIVVAVNKWDAIEKDGQTMNEFKTEIQDHLGFLPNTPVLFVSAKTGQRIHQILEAAPEHLFVILPEFQGHQHAGGAQEREHQSSS